MSCNYPSIVCTELVLSGAPRINGRRLAVGDIVSLLEGCGDLKEAVEDYELKVSEIRQALQYCSSLQCKTTMPTIFCHNCSLRLEQEGTLDTSDLEKITLGNSVFVKDENALFLGSMSEMLDEWNGKDRWKIAADLLLDLRSELF